ncbi:hypothetical protein SEA_LUCKYSOCKE_196 [Streptomyces phage LuckySocke]|jgi:hypothetical protein|nr:hypothetical protein SEA_ALONE_200 [Streptomyces phage Alone3]WPH58872.1 hypothetical protein SEA_LUCKYSOCKE_196 [Streptomyces phage LuckySocke]
MRPTFHVETHYAGKFHVSTIVDDRGEYETRFFRTERISYQGEDIPQIMRDAVGSTTWDNVTAEKSFVNYDSEAVSSYSRADARKVHATFVKILTDFNSGTLA